MKRMIFIGMFCFLAAAFLPAQSMLEGNGINLSWETQEDRLIVTLTAQTTGWIAFGTDATRVMKDANIIIVWVDDATGIAMGEDHFGTGLTAHKQDMDIGGSQDLQILSGSQTGDTTSVTFSIPLNSGDEYDTLLENGQSYSLLLAAGKTDNIKKAHNQKYKGEISIL